jgi:hypothetical protein
MAAISLILLVFAFVLLMLAAFNIPNPPKVHLGWLGLACVCLSVILSGLSGLHLGGH